MSALALAVNATRALPVLWAYAECAHYARLIRRRVALGLADPLVANRFALWRAWTGALVSAGVAVWLAFFPPAFYRRWVRAGVVCQARYGGPAGA